jgi:hypothetical protein
MHDLAQARADDARRAVRAPTAGEAGPATPAGPRRRRLLLAAAVAVYAIGLAELGSRAFWWWRHGVPLVGPGQLLSRVFYPELRLVEAPAPRDAFTILVLGGSVVADSDPYNRIPTRLAERLTRAAGRPVVVRGLAQAGHSTRDSLLKYRALADRRFDLVVVYHGINDARANNAPPEVFRRDYSHYAWYAQVNALARHPEARWIVLRSRSSGRSCACTRRSGPTPTCRGTSRAATGSSTAATCGRPPRSARTSTASSTSRRRRASPSS